MARARARVPSGECGALRGRRRHQKVPLPDRLPQSPIDRSTGLCCLSIDPSTVLILVEYWPQDSRARESMGNGRGIPSVTSVGTSCARSWSCRSRRRARATPTRVRPPGRRLADVRAAVGSWRQARQKALLLDRSSRRRSSFSACSRCACFSGSAASRACVVCCVPAEHTLSRQPASCSVRGEASGA